MNSYSLLIHKPLVRRKRGKKIQVYRENNYETNQKFLEKAYHNTVAILTISKTYANEPRNWYIHVYDMQMKVSDQCDFVFTIKRLTHDQNKTQQIDLSKYLNTVKTQYQKNLLILMSLQRLGLFEEFKQKMDTLFDGDTKTVYDIFNEKNNYEIQLYLNTRHLFLRHDEFNVPFDGEII